MGIPSLFAVEKRTVGIPSRVLREGNIIKIPFLCVCLEEIPPRVPVKENTIGIPFVLPVEEHSVGIPTLVLARKDTTGVSCRVPAEETTQP